VLAVVSLYAVQAGAGAQRASLKTMSLAGKAPLIRMGVLTSDMLKAPDTHAAVQPAAPYLTPLTADQRAAYERQVKQHPQAAPGPVAKRKSGGAISPNFVGGGSTPLFVRSAEGLSSAQGGGAAQANVAVATDLSYVMEAVDNAVAIYRTSSGALAYGPYSASSFFTPIKQTGTIFTQPQTYYDTARDRWVVIWNERAPGSPTFAHGYIDVAISVTNSPTQPVPGAQYYEYQFSANFQHSGGEGYCDLPTLGMDYWGLYISCAMFDTSDDSFLGNSTLAISKAGYYSGNAGGGGTKVFNNIQTCINTCAMPDGRNALRVSPALEDGTPDTEWIVATAAGFGSAASNALNICALTNTSVLGSGGTPTFTCYNGQTPDTYGDPVSVRQSGTGVTLPPDIGTKQVILRSGSLWIALTDGAAAYDRIYWVEIRPALSFLSTHNPQWSDVFRTLDSGFFDNGSGSDLFAPAIMPSQEGDALMMFTLSGPSNFPTLVYTGRRSYDTPHHMGQDSFSTPVGTAGTSSHLVSAWSSYSSCAMQLNSVTRGTLWCGLEYHSTTASPGWNTRLAQFRLE
jgi:hypothetical protein